LFKNPAFFFIEKLEMFKGKSFFNSIHIKVRKIGLGGRLGARRDGGARINGQIGNLVGQAPRRKKSAD
jgi:hypothetical protein